jgi:tetratricopeptide (TPR) repeat protein
MRSLSVSHNKLGKILEDSGQLEASRQERRAALDIRVGLLASEPSARARRDVMIAREKLGDVLRQLQRLDEASVEMQEALHIARTLQEADPAGVRAMLDLARTELALAMMERERGQFDAAATLCRTALERAQTAAATGSPDAERTYLVAKAREGLARALHGTSPAASLDTYRDALQTFDEVPRLGPENTFIAVEQAALSAALGLALVDAGEPARASEQLEAALARLAALGSDEELNAEVRSQVEHARARLAELRPAPP